MANRNWSNSGRIFAMHAMPILLDCNFVVDSTNGNGLGIRSLKGPTIANVFMHTSASPLGGNPNPASGTIVVQMMDNYTRSYSGGFSIVSPLSGSALKIDNSALTAGVAYTITTLGADAQSVWTTLGVPAGVTPAVGVSFIAANAGGTANTSTSRVMITASTGSSVAAIETVGDPNLSSAPNPTANQGFGAQFILQCRDYAGALVAPVDGSTIALTFYLGNSSVKSSI